MYLKIMWDITNTRFPQLRVVQGDGDYPEYQMGRLRAIHVFTEIETGSPSSVFRTHEVYDLGEILTRLYRGSADRLRLRVENGQLLEMGIQPISCFLLINGERTRMIF